MKIATSLGLLNPRYWLDVVLEADALGYESVWMPDHLIFPTDMSGSPFPGGEHPPVPPSTHLFDVFTYLGFFAGQTKQIRLGTNVYLLGLRHPFVAARAVQTLDIISAGRAEIGIGAGWLRNEWEVTGLDQKTSVKRLDEALTICKRLWTEEIVEHQGEHFEFSPVMFEPKPVQKPHPPIYVGGESEAALRRVVRFANGWYGISPDFDVLEKNIRRLREMATTEGRDPDSLEIIIGGVIEDQNDVRRYEELGATRVIIKPWERSKDALEGLRRVADKVF
jgi:probable F420-dependent oxidoreductase